MNAYWLKIFAAGLVSAAVFVAPGCGSSSNDGDDGNDGSDGDDGVDGVFEPVEEPIGETVDSLEECSGLPLGGSEDVIFGQLDVAEALVGGLTGLGLDGDDNLDDLLEAGNIIGGDSEGSILNLTGDLRDQLGDFEDAGLIGGAELDEVLDQLDVIDADVANGLPLGVGGLADNLDILSGLLADLPVAGEGDDALAAARLLDVFGGLTGQNADLLDAIAGGDSAAFGTALSGIPLVLGVLDEACGAVLGNEELAGPLGLVQGTLDTSTIPIVGDILTALGLDLLEGGTDPGALLTSVISGDLTELGGLEGLTGLLAGGELDELTSDLIILGDLLGPAAGLDVGGLDALALILDPASGLPGASTLLGGLPGLETADPTQVLAVLTGLITPGAVGGSPIQGLLGLDGVLDLDLLEGLLGGLLGDLLGG